MMRWARMGWDGTAHRWRIHGMWREMGRAVNRISLGLGEAGQGEYGEERRMFAPIGTLNTELAHARERVDSLLQCDGIRLPMKQRTGHADASRRHGFEAAALQKHMKDWIRRHELSHRQIQPSLQLSVHLGPPLPRLPCPVSPATILAHALACRTRCTCHSVETSAFARGSPVGSIDDRVAASRAARYLAALAAPLACASSAGGSEPNSAVASAQPAALGAPWLAASIKRGRPMMPVAASAFCERKADNDSSDSLAAAPSPI